MKLQLTNSIAYQGLINLLSVYDFKFNKDSANYIIEIENGNYWDFPKQIKNYLDYTITEEWKWL